MVKRSTKKLIRNIAILLFILIVLVVGFQQFTFIDTQFFGTVRCDKETGCTFDDLAMCDLETKDLIATEGFICQSDCSIRCSDTSEMRRRSDQDYQNQCDIYSGGGALVEAVAVCKRNMEELDPRAKTVCADGNQHVFLSGSEAYPNRQQWQGLDVYYMNDIDQLKERKESCSHACRQVTDTRAECIISEEDPNNYVKLDHKGCFAFSNRWEVWWFDNQNIISQRIEVCDELCTDGQCKFEDEFINPDPEPDQGFNFTNEDGDDVTTPPNVTCTFGSCFEDVKMSCSGGSEVVAYDCINTCAEPTDNLCPDGQNPITQCLSYQDTLVDGSCKFNTTKFLTIDGVKSFFINNPVMLSIVLGLLLLIVFIFTNNNNKYKKRTKRKRRS